MIMQPGLFCRLVLLGVPFVTVTSAIAADAPTPELELLNRSGIKVRPIGDRARPMLAVYLPGSADTPAAVVEMPEHAWGRRRGHTEQEWFYRLYTNSTTARGQTTWQKSGGSLLYTMTLPSGSRIIGRATLQDDGLAIDYRIHNGSNADYDRVMATTCIKLYRPFNDVFLERTYVHHHDGLDLLAAETPERLRMNAEEWLPCRYIARCAPQSAPAAKRTERQPDGVVRYNKLRLTDAAFLATACSSGGWVAATHSLAATSVFSNPARTCHHADPSTEMPPNGTAALSLKLYLLRGTVEDAWNAVGKSRALRRD